MTAHAAQRQDLLLTEIRLQGGPWTRGRTLAWYQDHKLATKGSTAVRDLHALTARGHLTITPKGRVPVVLPLPEDTRAGMWLLDLPDDDPAFGQLHRAAAVMCPTPESRTHLRNAHRRAITEAALGNSLGILRQRAEDYRRQATRYVNDGASRLEAIGYALGVTTVHAALRHHRHLLPGR